jgi:hypothetical protein
VVKEDKISLPEVLRILEESKENIINKKLTDTSEWIKKISEQLKMQELVNKDIQKMNFWIRLPMNWEPTNSIRASEILHDDDDIPEELRKQFCKTSYRVRSFESFDW